MPKSRYAKLEIVTCCMATLIFQRTIEINCALFDMPFEVLYFFMEAMQLTYKIVNKMITSKDITYLITRHTKIGYVNNREITALHTQI